MKKYIEHIIKMLSTYFKCASTKLAKSKRSFSKIFGCITNFLNIFQKSFFEISLNVKHKFRRITSETLV